MPTARHLTHATRPVNAPSPIPSDIVPQLRDQYLEHAHPGRLPRAHPRLDEIIGRHGGAISDGQPCYEDPSTGLMVFTAAVLAERGYCCDSGCRHCPFVID